MEGVIVERNPEVALMLYKRAADTHQPGANFKVGLFFHHRPGRDTEAAEAYYQAFFEGDLRAEVAIQALIDSGSTIARFYQGMIFQTKQEWEKAYACYHSDNLSRYAPALYQLGTLFQSDRCTKTEPKRLVFGKNVGEELRWYKAAALCGHE